MPQIISMAHEHGLDIVVEGLETEAQVNYFRGISDKLSGQGWFFGRPVDATSVQALVGNITPSKKRGRSRASAAK
ncbi:hypothetical protein FQZ97_945060 [compost metagenome]